MNSRTLTAWKGAALAAALISSLATIPATSSLAAGKDEIIVAQAGDVYTMNPLTDPQPTSITVFRNIFDPLTEIGPDGAVIPRLAISWEASPDQTVWTYKLRQNAKFHNGKPVTADDVVWTYNTILGMPRSGIRPYLVKVKSVEKVDDYTVKITLNGAYSLFDRQTALVNILPKDVEGAPDNPRPIGSGPFKFVEWKKDDHITLAANADYWGGAPKVKTLIFRPVPSESARAAGLMSGELDVVPLLPPAQVPQLEKEKAIKVIRIESNRSVYLGMNVTIPPLDNLKVRQAMDYAVNRDAITSRLLKGFGKPSAQPVAPSVFGYDPTLKNKEPNVEKAKALLKESGYKGEKIVYNYATNAIPFADQVAQIIAGYLTSIGMTIELQPLELAAMSTMSINHKLTGIYTQTFSPSNQDADLGLILLFETGSRGYWNSKEVDDLSAAQRAEGDKEKRKEILSTIWKKSLAESGGLYLYTEIQAYGVNAKLDWKPRADGALNFKDVGYID